MVKPCSEGSCVLDAVEIFKVDTSQWYKSSPIPLACRDIALVSIGDTCFAMGGFNLFQRLHLNCAFSASIRNILHNAVPINQTLTNDDAWTTFENTPKHPVLAGNLIVVGGMQTSDSPVLSAAFSEVYAYSHSINSWVYISDLPAPRTVATAAVLSPTEILVLGGGCGDIIVDTVYKGTIQLKM